MTQLFGSTVVFAEHGCHMDILTALAAAHSQRVQRLLNGRYADMGPGYQTLLQIFSRKCLGGL